MSKDDGNCAFPVSNVNHCNPCGGMSLRDYFAARMLSHPANIGSPDEISKWAYLVADAMLREQNK